MWAARRIRAEAAGQRAQGLGYLLCVQAGRRHEMPCRVMSCQCRVTLCVCLSACRACVWMQRISVYAYVPVHTCMHACMHPSSHAYMLPCIHPHRRSDRQTGKQHVCTCPTISSISCPKTTYQSSTQYRSIPHHITPVSYLSETISGLR